VVAASTLGFSTGMLLSGSGVPTGTTISSLSGGTITMSANATTSGTLVSLYALPNVSRKCITISGTAIYVGTLNSSSICTAIEQYTLAGAYTKTWTAAFANIGGLAVDSSGNVHAFDQGASKVKVFDSAGTLLRSWGSAGAADGQFSAASGYMVHAIAVDELKNVYIADWGNSRIQVFDSAGMFKLKFGTQGDLPGQFKNGPAAVAYSPDGFILAYDTTYSWYHVSQFTAAGTFTKRTIQLINDDEPRYARADYGYGGERAFGVSKDGLLLIGSETVTWYSMIAGASRVFQANNITFVSSAVFPSYVVTRGAAFDSSGNVWSVRGAAVECLDRRMRFDVYKPSKPLPQPLVLKVSQQPGSTVVDIDYQVNAPGTATLETAIAAFVGGARTWDKLVVPKTFSGSTTGVIGTGVPTGTKVRVSWDAAVDMPGQAFASMAFEVLARDDRDLVGVHYAIIPADATNPAPLKISNKPVQDSDIWDMLLWLLLKGDSRLSVSTTKVMLTVAGQAYIAGAPSLVSGTSLANTAHNGSLVTTQGRQFAYKYLNCRPITAAEKTRALAGNFGLNSVTENSVISLAP
jgi:NHL repeat